MVTPPKLRVELESRAESRAAPRPVGGKEREKKNNNVFFFYLK